MKLFISYAKYMIIQLASRLELLHESSDTVLVNISVYGIS